MKRLAFVVVRYGKEINGGAELHCRMLAERLTTSYQVDVLTTCVKSYSDRSNAFPEGMEVINGVTVHRFKSDPVRFKKRSVIWNASVARYLRLFLYKTKLLTLLANKWPVWNLQKQDELRVYRRNVFYSSGLFSYIKENKDKYDVFIPITIDYPTAYYTALYAGEKTLLIPTMHYQHLSFRTILTEIFTKVAYIGFNMETEMRLAEKIFGKSISPHGVVSVGFEITAPADWEHTCKKFNLPKHYLLYVGRVNKDKLNKVFSCFLAYKKQHPKSDLKFVIVGGLYTTPVKHPDIIYTGFVEESEKTAIIQHATVIVNPSKHESLSLILLEALSLKKAMITNAKCNVMLEHYEKSDHAIQIYHNKKDFIKKLHQLASSESLRKEMGEKGAEYIRKNYQWDIIMQRLIKQIEIISNK